jgi:hypothetical protein
MVSKCWRPEDPELPGYLERQVFWLPNRNGVFGKRHQNFRNPDGAGHFPSMTLTPSQTAPTTPVTIIVMTALKV